MTTTTFYRTVNDRLEHGRGIERVQNERPLTRAARTMGMTTLKLNFNPSRGLFVQKDCCGGPTERHPEWYIV
jgi:hypothetical protein